MTGRIIIIPARLQATRLPRKPLADIAGEPMIVHVWRRAIEAEAGPVLVATDAEEIAQAVTRAGGEAIMTRTGHASGSDRVFEAVCKADPGGAFDIVINLQGDLPALEPSLIPACAEPLEDLSIDIGTLAAQIAAPGEAANPSVVKVIGTASGRPDMLRALYFTRAQAPFGPGPLYHHIGIYAYRRAALERFVSLSPSPLELREKLEQLRALEAGMHIGVKCVDTVPLGVDTPADLEQARAMFAQRDAGQPSRSASPPTGKASRDACNR